MRRIRVLVVDDHGLMVEAVRLALEREGDIALVGEARRGADVLPEVARRQPDVVLLDIRMPDVDGLETLGHLRRCWPGIRVVMFSGIGDPDVAQEALRLGAAAYVDKRTDPATLASTLRRVVAGEATGHAVTPEVPEERQPLGGARLTQREREILARVVEGHSNGEIAGDLFLSEQTVKYHLTNVYRKLGVEGRAGVIRVWFEHEALGSANGPSNSS
jgi:DNA-binding NarL/FixJ family response regulator